MHIMRIPFYLGVLAALLGAIILGIELPKLHEYIQNLLTDSSHYQIWLLSKEPTRLSLERNVFKALDYNEVNGIYSRKWDILWSVEYPFHRHRVHLNDLQRHQRINHFPGLSFLTIKKHLATKFSKYSFIPNGFTFPNMKNDFEKFIKENPSKRFVEKNWFNRGVKLVRDMSGINFETLSTNEKFLQEFIEKPYLIDNRMFDIGIYVLITSFDPLRVYKFNKEILLRFCAEEYHPFDEDNTRKFVVQDDSIYVWDLPSLRDYILKLNYTSKEAFEIYMNQNSCDVAELWERMDDVIVKLLLDNEQNVITESKKFGHSPRNFFEILRFDFILDESLNIHLMEINMSPNLGAIRDFSDIKRNYRSQLVHDTLSILGLTTGKQVEESKVNFIVSDEKDVIVPTADCLNDCECTRVECIMCSECTKEYQSEMQQSFREHMRRGRMKRIFPTQKHYDEKLISHVSPSNQFAIKWFKEKCKLDAEWC